MAYIDRDKLIENKFKNDISYNAFVNLVKRQPTANVVDKERYDRLLENSLIISDALSKYQSADMVEVVRCKDCKHREQYDCNHITLGGTKCGVTDDWFCADGERKETENEKT